MRLSDFLRSDISFIMTDWEEYAKNHVPVAAGLTTDELRDHLSSILKFIADDMDSSQTKLEQKDKSEGAGLKAGGAVDSAAETHADIRFLEGFDPLELMGEFRALRASVTRLWENKRSNTDSDYKEMVRFNESIDQVQMEGFSRYIEKVNQSRNLFMGTLVHDLRDPLGAISLGAQLLRRTDLDSRQKMLAEQIEISASRMVKLVTDLIDDVRARLGKGLPISTHPMNMGTVVASAVSEIQLAHPQKKIAVHTSGNLAGEWDESRIGQVLSNLIGNAIQHTEPSTFIQVIATGKTDGVDLHVHNDGQPIPSSELVTIFEPMKSIKTNKNLGGSTKSMGLGLFIVKEIVQAHGGQITVSSTQQDGTTFSVQLPRKQAEST